MKKLDSATLGANRVSEGTRTARNALLMVFAVAGLLVAALVVERVVFQQAGTQAEEQLRTALRIESTILLEDERLTQAATLAAATGDERWIRQYEAQLPAMDAAIRSATELAPAAAAARFDQATRSANDRLVEMERAAFANVGAGHLAAAQEILQSPRYLQEKAVLSRGSDALIRELEGAAADRVAAIKWRSWSLVGQILLAALVGGLLLWRRLNLDLHRSEAAYSTKESEVVKLALHDTLTGLANRRYLYMQMESAIARAQRDRHDFAVMVLDLDGFKAINDRFGHSAGDALLIEISQRLSAIVRKSEIAARLGGDEFVVVLNHGESGEEPLHAAKRLIAALSETVTLEQGDVHVGASVGVSFYPADATEAEDLLRKADVALYRAKDDGGGDVRFFQQSMDDDVRERAALELELRRAIADGQIVPYFQPLIDLATGTLTGFEVLARWIHPTRGVVSPNAFVPIAETTNQIDALTVSVMRAALNLARDWDDRLTIAINISPQQLRNDLLAARLLDVLQETGFPPHRFEIEITENALIGDLDMARRVVIWLKEHGIRVALDDFGTGYSSLSHLSELPFDKIKIDRSFIHTLRERPESAMIVNAIIGLGRSMNLPTTAEGIESEADAEMLAGLGCQSGQGYLYSRPVAAMEAEALIDRYLADPATDNRLPPLAAAQHAVTDSR